MPYGVALHIITTQPVAITTSKPEPVEAGIGEFISLSVKDAPKSAPKSALGCSLTPLTPRSVIKFGLCAAGAIGYGVAGAVGGPFLGTYLGAKGLSDGAIAGVLCGVFGTGPVLAFASPLCLINVKSTKSEK